MASEKRPNPSPVLVQEYFAAGDDRFLEELAKFHTPKPLAPVADKWKTDPRPWARRQILAYLEQPLSKPGHEPIVKRLFKQAESARDDELMAAFLAAFDRLVRRVRKRRMHYDWQTRQAWEEESLVSPRDRVRAGDATRRFVEPATGETGRAPHKGPRSSPHLFSYRTRYYLRRRVWRYFRHMGYQRPDAYVRAAAGALRHYRDDDFATGENILDNWGLLQICFRHHAALDFRASTVGLRQGRSLGELTPAPRFPDLWRRPDAAEVLLTLLAEASSRLVRVWAMGLLRREHKTALKDLAPDLVLGLLDHADEEVQQFGAEVFGALAGLDKLPIESWMRLLTVKSPAALSIICDLMARHVAPERLGLAERVDLCCAAPAPVARMGFEFIRQTELTAQDRGMLTKLAGARCAAVAGNIAEWALAWIGGAEHYDRDGVVEFFDARLPETRQAALAWLRPGSPGYDDPQIWARLIETPFDNVRLALIDLLERRARLPGAGADRLAPVWCAVLLGVHRGGRQKPKAVHQLAGAIADDPSRAERLAPLLAVAVRSIRGPEHRAGLAAVVELLERRPELLPLIRGLLPELNVVASEAPAA